MNDWRDDQNLAMLRVAAERHLTADQRRRKRVIAFVSLALDLLLVAACFGILALAITLIGAVR